MEERPWHKHYDYTVSPSIRYPRIPVGELLNLTAKAHPNKTATLFFDTPLTYWELREQAVSMAHALASLGVTKGDRVAIQLPTCPQYMVAYYGALFLGAIVLGLNTLYTVPELNAIVEKTSPSVLIAEDTSLESIRDLTKKTNIPNIIITKMSDYINGEPRSTAKDLGLEKGWHHFPELLEKHRSRTMPRVDINPEDPALLQLTGGTTGVPKAAVLTHGNVIAGIFQAVTWATSIINYTPYERRINLTILPLFHIYGNIVALGTSVMNCATQILVPRFEIDDLMELLSQHDEITFFPTVPTVMGAIMNHPRAEELELEKKFTLFNSGGAPIPVELIDRIKGMGISFNEGWGMSETTALGICNPVMGLKKTGSIGIPFPDMDVRLVDIENGVEDVPPGEPGEIIIKGPVIMKEYWNAPEETAQMIRDGWLYTGDIAVRDEDEYIYIVDRKKDMIIAGGYNIYPRELDEVLYQHEKILEAVTVGIPDDYRGETVKAFIVPKPDVKLTIEEVEDFCSKNLAAYKRPKLFEFRNELPKSAVGKILRKVLRDEEIVKMEKVKQKV